MSDSELKAILAKLIAKIDDEASKAAHDRTENAAFRATVEKRLDKIDARLDGIDIRLSGIDKRQDDQNAVFGTQ